MNDWSMEDGYLYVTSAKGIQSYIFRSNRLREMVGASEIVEGLPNWLTTAVLPSLEIVEGRDFFPLVLAAGAARIVFRKEEHARQLAKVWPFLCAIHAPGLEVVQAIVPITGRVLQAISRAETEIRARRNLAFPEMPIFGPPVLRTPRTGLPAYKTAKRRGAVEVVDRQSAAKLDQESHSQGRLLRKIVPHSHAPQIEERERWPREFDDLAGEDRYLAVVHADANQLGKILMDLIGRRSNGPGSQVERYQAFSSAIDASTAKAAQKALTHLLAKADSDGASVYPFRPIVCAGDDFTAVMKASDALQFVGMFLGEFETQTQASLSQLSSSAADGLTACAGIAFVKKSYPFNRAYELSESLCKHAKNRTGRNASAVAFVRVTTDITGSYEDVLQRELTVLDPTSGEAAAGTLILTMNPYVVGQREMPSLPRVEALAELQRHAASLPSGSLRGVVTAMYRGREPAEKAFWRMVEVTDEKRGLALLHACSKVTGNQESPLWAEAAKDIMQTPLLDLVECLSVGCEWREMTK